MGPDCGAPPVVVRFSAHGKLEAMQKGRAHLCGLRAAPRGAQQALVTSFEVTLSLQSQFTESVNRN